MEVSAYDSLKREETWLHSTPEAVSDAQKEPTFLLLLPETETLKSGGLKRDDSLTERKPNNNSTLVEGPLRVEVSAYRLSKREET